MRHIFAMQVQSYVAKFRSSLPPQLKGKTMHYNKLSIALTLALAGMTGNACAHDRDHEKDFGLKVQHQLRAQSEKLFGVEQPLTDSAPATVGAYRTLSQTANDQVL
ncbi:MAG: hypothetical protein Q8L39_09590, partial [Burkholderiales bacterium]|nr:hypothetical protein [Burkholderiales bacterium]